MLEGNNPLILAPDVYPRARSSARPWNFLTYLTGKMMLGALQKTISEESSAECFVRALLSVIDEPFPQLFELLERILERDRTYDCPCSVKQLIASHIFAAQMIVLSKMLLDHQSKVLRRRCIETFAASTNRNVEEIVLGVAMYERFYDAHERKPEEAVHAFTRHLCENLGVKFSHQDSSMNFRDLTVVSALRVLFAGFTWRWKRLSRQTHIALEPTAHICHLPRRDDTEMPQVSGLPQARFPGSQLIGSQ
jgi:hypothetical protein